jgi:hypothetical protein
MISTTAFERGIEPVFSLLTAEQVRKIVASSADSQLESSNEELAGKCNGGELIPEEHAECEDYVRANKLVAILQAHGRRILGSIYDKVDFQTGDFH